MVMSSHACRYVRPNVIRNSFDRLSVFPSLTGCSGTHTRMQPGSRLHELHDVVERIGVATLLVVSCVCIAQTTIAVRGHAR
jgi:hypothetical protein